MQFKFFLLTALTVFSCRLFSQSPCAPNVVCRYGITSNLIPTNIDADPEPDTLLATVKVMDFVLYGQNNCGAPGPLEYSMRKAGTGTGWPGTTTLQFGCSELGPRYVEIWVRDGAGNLNFTIVYAGIFDIMNDCDDNLNTNLGCVNDVQPPSMRLIHGLAVNLGSDHSATVHAAYLVYAKTDNCPGKITLRIAREGFATDPVSTTSVTFDCNDVGTQILYVWAIDQNGNWTRGETYVIVQDYNPSISCLYPPQPTTCTNDLVPPQIILRNGIAVGMRPVSASTAEITLPAKDFVFNVSDNCSNGPFTLKTRKSGTGSGVPTPEIVKFACSEVGPQVVEVWAKDNAGNWDFSKTFVSVQNNLNFCLSPNVGTYADLFMPTQLKEELMAKHFTGGISVGRMPVGEKANIIMQVAPNPVTDHFTLTLQAQQAGHTALYLYDGLGRLLRVLEADATLLEGDNVFTYQVQDLPSGSYRVVAAGANGVTTVQLVK